MRGTGGYRRPSTKWSRGPGTCRWNTSPIGGHVVVPLRWGGLGVGSGVTFAEREETWVFTLRDGKIRHVREYATKKEAIEAAAVLE